jgi:hypothetical protein
MSQIENQVVVLFSFLPNVFFPRFFKCWVASRPAATTHSLTPDSLTLDYCTLFFFIFWFRFAARVFNL